MTAKKDSRLTGKKFNLMGVTLIRCSYRPNLDYPEGDYDHCEFCFKKFSLDNSIDAIRAGYATLNEYHWICPDCFENFKETYIWKVVDSEEIEKQILSRKQLAEKTRQYQSGNLSWEELMDLLGDLYEKYPDDELIFDLYDKIEHEPKRGGLFGVS